MDNECKVSGKVGHVWRRHGTYRRKDGSVVQRWQCSECKQTTTRRPGRESLPICTPGPKQGHTADGSRPFDSFLVLLVRHATQVGLHEAAQIAARTIGVHRSTASRWLRRTSLMTRVDSMVEWKLLSVALGVNKGRHAMPKADGVGDWRIIRGWEYLQWLDEDFEELEESRELRRQSYHLWWMLLDAAAVASVTVGHPGPLDFASLSSVSSAEVEALRFGGLLMRRRKRNHFFTYWLSFEQREGDPVAIAKVCTRTRVVGIAGIRFPWMPPMTVRLDPNRATKSGTRILIPVPSATRTFHRTPLTFPLELDFENPEAIALSMDED